MARANRGDTETLAATVTVRQAGHRLLAESGPFGCYMKEILMKKKTSLSKFGMAIMIAGGVLLALRLAVGDLSVLSVSSSVLIIVSGFLLYRSQLS